VLKLTWNPALTGCLPATKIIHLVQASIEDMHKVWPWVIMPLFGGDSSWLVSWSAGGDSSWLISWQATFTTHKPLVINGGIQLVSRCLPEECMPKQGLKFIMGLGLGLSTWIAKVLYAIERVLGMLAKWDLAANNIYIGMWYSTGDVILRWGCDTPPGMWYSTGDLIIHQGKADCILLRQITISNSNHTAEAGHSEA